MSYDEVGRRRLKAERDRLQHEAEEADRKWEEVTAEANEKLGRFAPVVIRISLVIGTVAYLIRPSNLRLEWSLLQLKLLQWKLRCQIARLQKQARID